MEKSIKRTLWNFEFIKNEKTRSVVDTVCKIMLYYAISSLVSVGTRIITGMIRGEGGAPDFVTSSFVTFGAVRELLFVLAYVLLARYIPIRNRIGKGLIFVFLFWTTDYLPQIMAMLGAYSPVIVPEAITFSTIVTDSFGYVINGLLLGLILSSEDTVQKKTVMVSQYAKSILISAVSFAGVLGIMEMLISAVNPVFSTRMLFQIAVEDTLQYYFVFYLFQAVSGGMFAVFYRLTEYNADRNLGGVRFIFVHGLMIWSPIILIMSYFGLSIESTILYEVVMMISLSFSHLITAKIFNKT